MKKIWPTICVTLCFLIGLSLLLYPSISNWWNSLHASSVIVDYEKARETLTEADYKVLFDKAEAYNRKIKKIDFPLMYHDQVDGYEDALNLDGSGVMGYITIDKIHVKLPILHGTSEGVLQKAIGHLEGTSLPTGGAGNHCVLSAHRGLPSAKLFTDLDQMKTGDRFTLTVLNRELIYEVDQILTVEPQEVEALYPVQGEDYCTLVTCTPYGVNSHRLLVRGRRVFPEEPVEIPITTDAAPLHRLSAAPLLGIPMIAVWAAYWCIKKCKEGSVVKKLLGILVLICAMTLPAQAQELPDLNQTGSISVTVRYNGNSVSGGELTLYRVGEVREDDGNYSFVLIKQFDASGVMLENVQSPDTAKKLSDFALRQGISGTNGKIGSDGTLKFGSLEPGLYLLAQRKAAAGYQKLNPFLVSLPMRDGEGYSYQVDASPKVSPVPDQPGNPEQPKTGQSAWPIWTFVVSAAALAVVIGYKKRV